MIYATVFEYMGDTICSQHRTFSGAEKEARKCEARGGARHHIWEIRKYRLTKRPAKKGRSKR